MHNTDDTATWWPPIGMDADDATSGAEDVLGDLSDPTVNGDGPGAGGMEANDYALPPEFHPVLSIVPRSYQVEALTAWQRSHGCGVPASTPRRGKPCRPSGRRG